MPGAQEVTFPLCNDVLQVLWRGSDSLWEASDVWGTGWQHNSLLLLLCLLAYHLPWPAAPAKSALWIPAPLQFFHQEEIADRRRQKERKR